MPEEQKTLDTEAREALEKVKEEHPEGAALVATTKAIVSEVLPTPQVDVKQLAKQVAVELQGGGPVQALAQALVTEMQHAPQVTALSADLQAAEDRYKQELVLICEMALTVLESCGVELKGPIIELYGGVTVNDMMTVKAFRALKAKAQALGIDEKELSLRVDGAYKAFEEELRANAETYEPTDDDIRARLRHEAECGRTYTYGQVKEQLKREAAEAATSNTGGDHRVSTEEGDRKGVFADG